MKGERPRLPQPAQRSAPDLPRALGTLYTPWKNAIAPTNKAVSGHRAPWRNRATSTMTTWLTGDPPEFAIMPTTCEAMRLSLNVLVFNACLPKGKKKEKWKGGKNTNPLNLVGVTSAKWVGAGNMGGGATKVAAHSFVCTSVIKRSNWWSEHRSQIFGGQDPFCLL